MSQLTFTLLVVALVYCIGAYADDNNQNIGDSFSDDLPSLPPMPPMPKMLTADDIKGITAQNNGHSEGTFKSSSSSISMKNGKVVNQKASGESVKNVDGLVTSSSYTS